MAILAFIALESGLVLKHLSDVVSRVWEFAMSPSLMGEYLGVHDAWIVWHQWHHRHTV